MNIATRNTLVARLNEAQAHAGISKADAIACKMVAESLGLLVGFDAWLDGPWHAVKDTMHTLALGFAVGLFLDGVDYLDAWREFRTYHIDPYQDHLDREDDADEE